MQTVGIICEYNPLHNGHLYQIRRTREIVGDSARIICAMSGNFVQRGEFAVFSKFARAKAAVAVGADLVIELPVNIAISSAEGFAMGGVSLLNSLGVCDCISFGSEAGELAPLEKAAQALLEEDMDADIKAAMGSGRSYAAVRQAVLEKKIGKAAEIISKPNNILAVEYLKAIEKTGSKMRPVTIARHGGGHDGGEGNSASFVRERLLSDEPWRENLPESAAEIFKNEIASGRGPVTMKAVETAILYRLRTMDKEDFEALPWTGEGLGLRFMKSAAQGTNVEDILEKTRTKRYAMSRIRRILLCAYLGMTREQIEAPPMYVRVLAVGRTGRDILREMREKCALPCVVKPAQGAALPGAAGELFRSHAAMSDLYSLAFPDEKQRVRGLDMTTSPYIEK